MTDTVLFDLDGTVLDTFGDLTTAVNRMLSHYGYPCRTVAEIKSFVGNGSSVLIRRAIPELLSDDAYAEAKTLFTQSYRECFNDTTLPFSGIKELLCELYEKGIKTAVVSNKADELAKKLCELHFGKTVNLTLGTNSDTERKPNPFLLRKALTELESNAGRAIMIGDSEVDMRAAANTPISFIAVTWGCRSRETLLDSGADILADNCFELNTLITKRLCRKA